LKGRLVNILPPMTSRTQHKSYLVRFHRGEGQRHWRASLQDVRSEQVIHFDSEQELMRALLYILSTALIDTEVSTPEV